MDGIIVIDKPAGMTSHDVVARARRILKTRRIGHTGTLDPFATGVLVLLIGRATRLAQFLKADEKEYEATIRFGYATTTGDITGNPLIPDGGAARPGLRIPDRRLIEGAMAELTGEIEQVPPMYSAKKVDGKRLYALARSGIEVERQAVRVCIKEFGILRCAEESSPCRYNPDGTCDLDARIICSAGTYVRTLAESLGEKIGVGAHLAALRRTRAGQLTMREAVSLDELQSLAETNAIMPKLISMSAALSEMPFAHLSGEEAHRVRHGASVRVGEHDWAEGTRVRLCDATGELIAIGEYSRARIQPRVLLVA